MGRGVHVELEVAASACRVADASEAASIRSVSRARDPAGDAVTVDFTATADVDLETATEVFEYGDRIIYRFERDADAAPACACEFVEHRGCPVRHVEADRGTVVLSFVAPDLQAIRNLVGGLRESFEGVSLRRLTRSDAAGTDDDLVFVDRAALTDRQREVLETAHEMGYFAHPKGANATEVADALGINRSTFSEHLSAAQSKLLDAILDG